MKLKVIFNAKADTKHINFSHAEDKFSEKSIKKEARRLVKERMPHNLDKIDHIEWKY